MDYINLISKLRSLASNKNINNSTSSYDKYYKTNDWFFFKRSFASFEEIGQYISSLSNSARVLNRDYGYLVFGIDDTTSEIVGTTFNPDSNTKDNEPLKHYLERQLFPRLKLEFTQLYLNKEGNEVSSSTDSTTTSSDDDNFKKVVIITVPCAKLVPTSFKNERYIRIGSSKEKLSLFPEREADLFSKLNEGHRSIVNVKSEYQDLTFTKLFMYYSSKGIVLNSETFIKNLGLHTKDGEYNILAQLLSDNSHIPLRVAIFEGKSKGSSDLFSVREFGYNCLLYSLDDLLRYGDVINIIQADERDRVVERKEVDVFSRKAFKEALINAVLHNKWVDLNEPMISVFSDRIEILSRGGLPFNQTKDGFFRGESVPRNDKLSEIFLQLHISEKAGRGVPTIIENYGRNVFTFNENSIVVTLPFKWLKDEKEVEVEDSTSKLERSNSSGGGDLSEDGDSFDSDGISTTTTINKDNNNKSDGVKNKKLNDSQKKILKAIEKNEKVTKKELSKILNKSDVTIDSNIRYLREHNYIKREGANKNGRWKLLVKKV